MPAAGDEKPNSLHYRYKQRNIKTDGHLPFDVTTWITTICWTVVQELVFVVDFESVKKHTHFYFSLHFLLYYINDF
jgi:hypothetical protein